MVVVIERKLDVIKAADWVINLDPQGDHRGDTILACGTPKAIAGTASSHTGRFLAPLLAGSTPGEQPAAAANKPDSRPPRKAAKKTTRKKAE